MVISNSMVKIFYLEYVPPNLFSKKSLLSIASALGKPVAVDKATQEHNRPSTTRVKVILDLLDKHPKKIKLFFVDKDSGKVIEHYQEFVYDNLPRYCIHCKRQGHDENSCRVYLGKSKSNKKEQRQLVPDDNLGEGRDSRNNLGVVRDATIDRDVANSSEEATNFNSNNKENLENKGKSIEDTKRGVGKDGVLEVEFDRSNIVMECTQFDVLRDENIGPQERIHGTDELSTEFGSTLGKSQPVTGVLQHTQNSTQFDKDANNLSRVPRDFNKNREHLDQQVVLTHENEFIVIEEIAGKEISPNTPIMVVSNPEETKNDLNVSKEK
ncbi:hypothetical protein H5410_061450 [Solanum commersonii]|uniref:DUF4283 domain-containing protein n=1 Tax=Solanum commersonii TaxID=4109 RepID=A0A9J5W8W6_SOLCO|nr:hypothetical protein H5410_061450 [Solanum commersonii]